MQPFWFLHIKWNIRFLSVLTFSEMDHLLFGMTAEGWFYVTKLMWPN